MRGPGRVRRILGGGLKVSGLSLVFAGSLVAGVVLHMGLRGPRELARIGINSLLEDTFQGRVVVHRLGGLSLTSASGIDAEVFDPEGRRVIALTNASARFGTFNLLSSLVTGDTLDVEVRRLDVDDADVVLDEDGQGQLLIANAFESRAPDTGEPSTPVQVDISNVHVAHLRAVGDMSAVPFRIDADADHVRGDFRYSEESMGITVRHVALVARDIEGSDLSVVLSGQAVLPADTMDSTVAADCSGYFGAVPFSARAAIYDREVEAALDIPETGADAINALYPAALSFQAPVAARVRVQGALPKLHPDVWLQVGQGEVAVGGDVTIPSDEDDALTADLHVDATGIDLANLQLDAPRSTLSASLKTAVRREANGEVTGTFTLFNQSGEVAGQLVPAATAQGGFTDRAAFGSAAISEPGAPTFVSFSALAPEEPFAFETISFYTDTRVPSLAGLTRVGPIGRGHAHASTKGTLRLDTMTISADALATVGGFSPSGTSDVSVGSARAAVAVSGKLNNPSFDAHVDGSGLKASGLSFLAFQADVDGNAGAMRATVHLVGGTDTPSVEARASVLLPPGAVEVRDGNVEISRQEVTAVATIPFVRVARDDITVRDVVVEGLGTPLRAAAHVHGNRLDVKVLAHALDLSRIAVLGGKRIAPLQGIARLDVDFTGTASGGARGHVNAHLSGLPVPGLTDSGVHVAMLLEDRRLYGEVSVESAKVGQVEVRAEEVQLAGPMLEPRSWLNATGAALIDAKVDLAAALERVPVRLRPVSYAHGNVELSGRVTRDAARDNPTGDLKLTTSHLEVVGPRIYDRHEDGSLWLGKASWQVEGIDGVVTVTFDGKTDDTTVDAQLQDRAGKLAHLTVRGKPPVARLIAGNTPALNVLRTVPIELHVEMPKRSLQELPKILGAIPAEGAVALEGDFDGTIDSPKLHVVVKGTGLRPKGRGRACATAVDLDATLDYDGAVGELQLRGATGSATVLAATAKVEARVADLLRKTIPADWVASAELQLTSFPMDLAEPVIDTPISGSLSGRVTLKDLHRSATLVGALDIVDLRIDRSATPRIGKVTVDLKDGGFTAEASLGESDGHFKATAQGSMKWGRDVVPTFAWGSPVDVHLDAKNFRIDVLRPFVEDFFTEIDGRIDTDAKIHIVNGGKDGSMDGFVSLRDASVDVPQIGERLHGIKGRLNMEPWGTVRLEEVEAQAPTGTLKASASAQLDGFALKSAKGKISIAKGESIPIAVEGVPIGRAYGDITASATMGADGKKLDVKVDVPLLHVELPAAVGNSVQPLEPDPNIRIGVYDGERFALVAMKKPEEVRKPSDLAVRVEVAMGRDIQVKRDTMLDLRLRGRTVIEMTDKTRVTGEIRTVRGRIELQGKEFTVERGIVSFVGDDPGDPLIQATAYWDAPDKTRVYADFSGFVSKGQLTLRSEPALTQDEILGLILFGSADGQFGASAPPGQDPGTGVAAVGVAGGVVTQGLNKVLSGFSSSVSTRIDSSEANNPQPQLVLQITKDLSARLGYKLGVAAPGSDPDRAQLTLDWRFIRNWSLATTVGDRGSTAVDVVWRMHY